MANQQVRHVERDFAGRRILQFGEGNFLRAFADWMITEMNRKIGFNGKVIIIQPIEQGRIDDLNRQNGVYHIVMKGLSEGVPVRKIERIDCIERGINPYADFNAYRQLAELPDIRFILSNTTESGIAFDPENRYTDAPAKSFPGKLTQLLHHRYTFFRGAKDKGFIFLPCELIDRNGDALKKTVLQYVRLWNLEPGFEQWINACNHFANTLVDRIVTGFPHETIKEIQEELGEKDELVSESEIFHLWVIEGNAAIQHEFPADKAGLNVLFVPDMKPYRDRKVTLLNGAHSVLAPIAFLYGLNTMREAVEEPLVGAFIRHVMTEELMPSLDLPGEELTAFAANVLERFRNPYIRHQLTGILLNSFSKYKTRDLPALKHHVAHNRQLPKGLVAGLAAICIYYKGGLRGNDRIEVKDDATTVTSVQKAWAQPSFAETAHEILASETLWGEDLNPIAGLTQTLASYLERMSHEGVEPIIREITKA
jgi:tagaturonate reductase